ncbi:anaerobic ribonucleoside-triphosphate reductase activating protein [Thermithiobacillus tepidarius DSM 3134]|uniref:anaerobic ribonucleoside-triphosphate reductase activating protein n=1 Tax=Thermithiobacillus tepidarius TaxID=929 RepID=UPI000401ABA2|nr:anaerobic ribonucleoside-triphosphate reductase activating protein [Thermithiobacillus tepidarius]
MPPLRVGGFVPLSATDFPDALAAVVFCQGCPWRCPYCHNPHLLPRRAAAMLDWAQILDFLRRRQGLLDAVVFSGGEPTLQDALPAALREVRALGFRVGLHSAGPHPARLAQVLPYLDWIGMDIKAPFADYAPVTGVRGSGARALASARLVLASGVPHEFRSTVHPALLSREAVRALARGLAELGARRFVLQAFRSRGCEDAPLREPPAGSFPDPGLCAELSALFEHFSVRA